MIDNMDTARQVYNFVLNAISKRVEGIAEKIESSFDEDFIKLYFTCGEHPFGGQNALAVDLSIDEYGEEIHYDPDTDSTRTVGTPESWPTNISLNVNFGVCVDGRFMIPVDLDGIDNIDRVATSVAFEESNLNEGFDRVKMIHALLKEAFSGTNTIIHHDSSFDYLVSQTEGYVLTNGVAVEFKEFYEKNLIPSAGLPFPSKKYSVSCELPESVFQKLENYISLSGKSFSTICEEALKQYLSFSNIEDITPAIPDTEGQVKSAWIDESIRTALIERLRKRNAYMGQVVLTALTLYLDAKK